MRFWSIASLMVVLAVVSGCASRALVETSPTPVDVTGTWQGTVDARSIFTPVGDLTLVLQQSGTRVTGKSSSGGDLEGAVKGNRFSYTSASGSADLTVNGNDMNGYTGTGAVVTLKRVR